MAQSGRAFLLTPPHKTIFNKASPILVKYSDRKADAHPDPRDLH